MANQSLNTGPADEFTLQIVSVMPGSCLRLFDNMNYSLLSLELVEVVETPAAAHMRYKLGKN